MFEAKGKIYLLDQVASGTSSSGKEWARQNMVLEEERGRDYVGRIALEANHEDTIKALGQFHVGDPVKVKFQVYAREWKGRWYNTLALIEITADGPAPKATEPAPATNTNEDLPF